MRFVSKLILGSMAALAACSQLLPGQEEAETPDEAETAATVTVAGDAGNCRFGWDGAEVTSDEVSTRSAQTVESAIAAAGGIEMITEETLPYVVLEAASDVPFVCVAEAVRDLAKPGMPVAVLRLAGTSREQRVYLIGSEDMTLDSDGAIELGSDDAVVWDGEAMTIDEAGRRAGAMDRRPGVEGIFVAPVEEALFGSVFSLVEAAASGGGDTGLAGCNLNPFDMGDGLMGTGPRLQGTRLPRCLPPEF